MAADGIGAPRRLVVKIGSSLLVDGHGQLNRAWLQSLAEDVAERRRSGQQVLLVSSGAVALGCHVLNLNRRRARLEEQQAAAALGQIRLARAYEELLGMQGIAVAQVLLTPDDTEVRRRFLNARGTLEKLLELGVVPVVNENDTVATDELRYGDNDRLAARAAQLVMAEGLVLLSDVDGLYDADPRASADARHIGEVAEVNEEIMGMAVGPGTAYGSGGMLTKLQAAQIATRAGCTTWIASGKVMHPLRALAEGARSTRVMPAGTPAAARKQWLAGMLEVRGELRIDAGATAALRAGNSLLPVGIVERVGQFERGDAVTLVDEHGDEIGRGLSSYNSEEIERIRGCRSPDITARLGYQGRAVVVHRDDLVLFTPAAKGGMKKR